MSEIPVEILVVIGFVLSGSLLESILGLGMPRTEEPAELDDWLESRYARLDDTAEPQEIEEAAEAA